MTPSIVLTAVKFGEETLSKQHGAVELLWRKFGQSIRAHRKARKYSLACFAKKLGVTAQMLAYMESGTRRWPMERAELAAKLLNRPEQWPDC